MFYVSNEIAQNYSTDHKKCPDNTYLHVTKSAHFLIYIDNIENLNY